MASQFGGISMKAPNRQYIEQCRAGLSVREIAEQNEVSVDAVNYNLRTYHAVELKRIRQEKWETVLAFVIEFKGRWGGCPPTVGEIVAGVGYSRGVVRGALKNLKIEGKIKFMPTGKIMVVDEQWMPK